MLDKIPILEQRRHGGTAILSYVVSSALGGECSPEDFLPGCAIIEDSSVSIRYSKTEALELQWLLEKHLISQEMLDLLDWAAVKAALPKEG